MEVTALCIRLLINVVILLVAHVQQSHPQTSDVRIVPSRLQLFEYESVSFTCEGSAGSVGWEVRNTKEVIKKYCNVTCKNGYIDHAIKPDSGEYWCEGGKGQRSNTVNITVTGGSVILESPVLPVMEGEALTLHCRQKTTSRNLTADFYKDGTFIKTDSTGNMTIHNVSKSDEGLYKCSISGAGESLESRLAVRGQCNTEEGDDVIMESPFLPVTEGAAVTLRCGKKETSFDLKADFYKDGLLIRSNCTGEMTINSVSKTDEGFYKCSISGAGESVETWLSVEVVIPKYNSSVNQASQKEINFSNHYVILLWTVMTVLFALQLLVIGLLYWKKQLVLLEAQMSNPHKDFYAVVKKYKKKKDTADAADNLSLCLNTNHSSKPLTEKESRVSSFTVSADPPAATDPPLPDQDSLYSTI